LPRDHPYGLKMLTHAEMKARMLDNPEVRAEYERIERKEMPMLDAILKARAEVGLTQAQVAAAMGAKAPAVARLENALITGSPSPLLATFKKYAAALGKRLEVRLV
jgi:DNA-binding XRE family transcriptional regulator